MSAVTYSIVPTVAPSELEELSSLPSADVPPLPTPNHAVKCRQNAVGTATVLSLCILLTSSAFILLRVGALPLGLGTALVDCLLVEALIAITCLAGLRWSQPDVIKRDLTLGFPDSVTRRLKAGEPLPTENIQYPEGSFCVRCLVWRPPAAPEVCCSSHANSNDPHAPAPGMAQRLIGACAWDSSAAAPICEYIGSPHHCSVCGRCVRDFSHHCGFFGRCITRGNLPYFRTIITIGHLSGVTFAVVLASSIAHSWASGSFATILPVALALWMSYFVANGGGGMLVTMCRFAVLRHCPRLSLDADPMKMPAEPMLVAVLGPWCGFYVPVRC